MLAEFLARTVPALGFAFTPVFAFIGVQELVIVAIIVLVLFGGRLPSVMRSLGKSIPEFKKGMEDEPQGEDSSDKTRK